MNNFHVVAGRGRDDEEEQTVSSEVQAITEPNFIVTYHEKGTRKELARFTDVRQLPGQDELFGLPKDGFFKISPYWLSYKGEKTPICDLSMEHLINIVKFSLSSNSAPPPEIVNELMFRDLLPVLAQWVPAQDGYISPEKLKELINERNASVIKAIDDYESSNDASDSSGVSEPDSGDTVEQSEP